MKPWRVLAAPVAAWLTMATSTQSCASAGGTTTGFDAESLAPLPGSGDAEGALRETGGSSEGGSSEDGAGGDGGNDGAPVGPATPDATMPMDGATEIEGGGTSAHWVGTWTGAPQLTESSNLPPSSLTNSTLRQVVHVSIGGSKVRLRFSNEFGNGALTINQAHIAVNRTNPADSTIDATTDRPLTFSGARSVTVPQGQAAWSDGVDFDLAPLGNLSVTVAFGNVPSNVTGHPGSRTTSYEMSGSTGVSAPSMPSAQTADHWYILSGIDVMADASTRAIVVLGDSITDGRGSTTNGNDRWPDDLAKRLQANASTANVAILNQGIGGNTVASGGLGPTGLSRFSRDVLGQSGVHWVVILEGVNDIGGGGSPSPVTSGYDQMVAQAHAQNLVVVGAPLLPFGGSSYDSSASEAARTAINNYIASGKFDGVIDLSTPVQSPSSPTKLQPSYDSGDHLHPNAAGYQKMADSVDLSIFTR